MIKAEERKISIAQLFFPVLLGLALILALLFVLAALILSEILPENALSFSVAGALFLAALTASFVSARRAVNGRFWMGLAAGGILFACLLLMSLAYIKLPLVPGAAARAGAVFLGSSLLGSAAGTYWKRARPQKKKKRRK